MKEISLTGFITFSLAAHLVFSAPVLGVFGSSKAEYSVEQASSSVDVNIVEERVLVEPEAQEVVMAVEVSDVQTEAVQKIEKQEKPKEDLKEIVSASNGAISESKPNYLKNPAPTYPMRARQKGWEGVVVLDVSVNEKGLVDTLSVKQSSGYEILDESAVKTVKKWQFLPANLGGVSLASRVIVPVRYQLEKK